MARIEHFALFSRDLEHLRDFYQDALGLKVVCDNSKAAVRGYFLADDQGFILEIIARPNDVAAGETRYMCHAAFWVDDFTAARHRLEMRGVTFELDTELDTPSIKTAFFRDPDGNRLQIVWRPEPMVSR